MTGGRLYYKHLSSAYFAFEVEMLTFLEAKYQILHLTKRVKRKEAGGDRELSRLCQRLKCQKNSEASQVRDESNRRIMLYNYNVSMNTVSSVEKLPRHQKYIIIIIIY